MGHRGITDLILYLKLSLPLPDCQARWFSWWRHQMETFSALLAFCAGNSPVTGEFPSQRPVTRGFDVFFDLCPNKGLSKQWWGKWFETLSYSLWRHSNVRITTGPWTTFFPLFLHWLRWSHLGVGNISFKIWAMTCIGIAILEPFFLVTTATGLDFKEMPMLKCILVKTFSTILAVWLPASRQQIRGHVRKFLLKWICLSNPGSSPLDDRAKVDGI